MAEVGGVTGTDLAVDRRQTTVSVRDLYPCDSLTDVYALAVDERMRNQTRGVSAAIEVRWRF